MPEKHFLEDKKILADFLEISLRTFDRYIKKYKIRTFRHNSKKKYDLKEILEKLNSDNFGQVETTLDNFGQFKTKYVKDLDELTLNKGQNSFLDKVRQSETKTKLKPKKHYIVEEKVNSDNQEKRFIQATRNEFDLSSLTEYKKEAEIYKKLYTEITTELKNKQERLEGATYRVGQLEAQLKHTVPLLSYRQKEEEVLKLEEDLNKQLKKQSQVEKVLQKNIQDLTISKNLYVILLFSFLFFLPLILIYFFK